MNYGKFISVFKITGFAAVMLLLNAAALSAQNTAPVASNLAVVGEIRPGMTIWATYLFTDADGDSEGASEYQWFTSSNSDGSDSTAIPSATGKSYKVADSFAGLRIGFHVIPVDSKSKAGERVLTPVFEVIENNNPPVAQSVSVSGTLNVDDVLTGNYTYSDYEGDLESGSELKWYRKTTPSGAWAQVATGRSFKIRIVDQRFWFRFGVVPKAATGADSFTEYYSAQRGPVNSAPYAINVNVTGTKVLGQPLQGHYDYEDDDPADYEGLTTFQWYRGAELIPGATSNVYIPGSDDVGSSLVFKVTPVTYGTGNPVIGDEVSSDPYGPVTDPSSSPPAASHLCIDGTMTSGSQLKGRYLYTNNYDEKDSKYLWYVNDVIVATGTYSQSYNYARYTLQTSDLGKKIHFAVIPQNKLGETGDTAFSQPMAFFTLPLRDNFSVTDPPEPLAASPSGGVFSGPGQSVSGNVFYPANLASKTDPYTLSYIVTVNNDPVQCTQTTYKNVWVKPVVATFSGLGALYCDNSGIVTVHVNNVPPLSTNCTFTLTDPKGNPAAVTMLDDVNAQFNPDLLEGGEGYEMTYSYRDLLGTTNTIKQKFTVEHLGVVKILNLSPDTAFCGNIAPFELFTSKTEGVITGPVDGRMLDPKLVPGGSGIDTVIYRVTSALGCIKEDKVRVIIHPVPQVIFAPEDYCITDINSDSTKMINNTSPAGIVRSWLWEFSEGGQTITDTARQASFLYRTGGFHKIFLTAVTVSDCNVRKEETFDIGVKPKADFTWKNECFRPDTSIYFFDATVSTSKIMSRSWNFFDIDSLRTVKNPVYPQKSVGYQPVLYKVTTGYAGCNDSIFREVYLRPVITLAADGYFEDFEDGSSHWVPGYESVNNWKFGTPHRPEIDKAWSGLSAWFTGFRTDTAVFEASSVVSPCFDFTNIERPMISLYAWKSLEKDRQGAALQYRTGDAPGWEYVGTLGDGINWYNSALIKGRPGGEQIGWTTDPAYPDAGFLNSRHKLDELSGAKDVKFRIAYGSDGTTTGYGGIAFDDVWIGPRSRKALLEHFTNITSKTAGTATAQVDTMYRYNSEDVIYIQYHTNFPGSDPYYNDNQGDAGGRMLYYGLSRVPYSFIDGGSDHSNYASLYDHNILKWDPAQVMRRSLIETDFEIALTADVMEGVLSVGGQIQALDNITAENLTLYLAVTENENDEHIGANGQTRFWNVFRKMIPDAGGIDLKKSWTKNETFDIGEHAWMIENIRDNSRIEVIAFLQNNVTRTVYQAASVRDIDIGVGINDVSVEEGIKFSIYPNPAVNKLTMDFGEPIQADADIRIYDLQGTVVSSFKAGAGTDILTRDELGLKEGIYLIRVTGKGITGASRKLVVKGR
jgi:hypothetical protein